MQGAKALNTIGKSLSCVKQKLISNLVNIYTPQNVHIKNVLCHSVNLPIKQKHGKHEIMHFLKKVLIRHPFSFTNHF